MTHQRALLCVLGALALPVPAWAQPAPTDTSPSQRAAELFAKGLEAMKQSDWATACPAIAESYRLEALPGALFTLAECRARAGQVASAMRDFDRYLELVAALPIEEQEQQQERIPVTKQRQRELEPRIPRMTIELSGDLPSGALVELDGVALKPEELGVPLPLDPGPHRVLVRVGARESDTSVNLAEGELRRIRLSVPSEPQLPPAAVPPTLPPSPLPEPTPPPAPTATTGAVDDAGASALWVTGWTSVALGGVGFVVAGTAGLVLLGKKDSIDANCTGTTCNDIGLAEAEDVPTLDTLGTTAFIAGGVLSAAGVVMLLVSSTRETSMTGLRVVAGHHQADAGVTVQLPW